MCMLRITTTVAHWDYAEWLELAFDVQGDTPVIMDSRRCSKPLLCGKLVGVELALDQCCSRNRSNDERSSGHQYLDHW
jgi:hypothetical protein